MMTSEKLASLVKQHREYSMNEWQKK